MIIAGCNISSATNLFSKGVQIFAWGHYYYIFPLFWLQFEGVLKTGTPMPHPYHVLTHSNTSLSDFQKMSTRRNWAFFDRSSRFCSVTLGVLGNCGVLAPFTWPPRDMLHRVHTFGVVHPCWAYYYYLSMVLIGMTPNLNLFLSCFRTFHVP